MQEMVGDQISLLSDKEVSVYNIHRDGNYLLKTIFLNSIMFLVQLTSMWTVPPATPRNFVLIGAVFWFLNVNLYRRQKGTGFYF
jgi:hypothetical protein